MSDNITKKDGVKDIIEKEIPNLNNLLSTKDLNNFKAMTEELRDTWTKKQMFRTETEARFSVLQDNRYPTKASKYWQCVREQSSYLDNLMTLSFDYRRNEAKIKWLEGKIDKEVAKEAGDKFVFDSDVKVGEVYKGLKRYVRELPGKTLNIKTLGRSIVRKDIKQLVSKDEENNVENVFNESVSKLEGSIKTSRQTFENSTLIIKHKSPINEEKRGARARDIHSMYIANASGERFRYPYKHLGGARCLAQHISFGGTHDDMVGEAIVKMSENLYKLHEFLNITKRQGLVNEANAKIIEGCKKKMKSIRESAKHLQTNKGYAAFVENLSMNGSNSERELNEDTFNEYVDRFTTHQFNETLRDIIPLIHTIKEESDAEDMKFTMERFVATYKRVAEPTMRDNENFTVYFTPAGIGGKGVDFGAAISNVQSSNYTNHTMSPNAKEAFKLGATLTSMANSIRVIEHQGKTIKARSGNGKVADEISNMLSDGAKLLEGNPAHMKIISRLPVLQKMRSIYDNKENVPSKVESIDDKLDAMVENAFKKYDPEYVLLENDDPRGDIPFGDEEVSSCCGASIDGETDGGFGRCRECGEMASVVTNEAGDSYTYHVPDYDWDHRDDEHKAVVASAKKHGVIMKKHKTPSAYGTHVSFTGPKKKVDHVIDNHVGRDDDEHHDMVKKLANKSAT